MISQFNFQIGKESKIWLAYNTWITFSECWAAWCFYGDDLFCASISTPREDKSSNEEDRNWCLQWNDLTITERFKTLDGAISSRRENEKGGLTNLQKHFGVRVAHKGFVTCIQ